MGFHRARYMQVDVVERTKSFVRFLDQDGVRRSLPADTFDEVYVPISSTTATIGAELG